MGILTLISQWVDRKEQFLSSIVQLPFSVQPSSFELRLSFWALRRRVMVEVLGVSLNFGTK